ALACSLGRAFPAFSASGRFGAAATLFVGCVQAASIVSSRQPGTAARAARMPRASFDCTARFTALLPPWTPSLGPAHAPDSIGFNHFRSYLQQFRSASSWTRLRAEARGRFRSGGPQRAEAQLFHHLFA